MAFFIAQRKAEIYAGQIKIYGYTDIAGKNRVDLRTAVTLTSIPVPASVAPEGPLPVIPAPGSKFHLSRHRHFIARYEAREGHLYCRVLNRRSGEDMACLVVNGGWNITFDDNGNGFEPGTRKVLARIETVMPESVGAERSRELHYEDALRLSAQVVAAAHRQEA